jgi:hypothetical protein
MSASLFRPLRAAALLAVLALAAPALGDQLKLKNGNTLEGKVRREGDEVVLVSRFGEMRFKASEVASVVEGPTTYDAYLERKKKAGKDDPKAQLALGDWCKQKGLKTESRRHWKRVLEIDADHAEARKRLGFIRHKDAWLTKAEYFEARGYVRVKGKWVPREEARRAAAQKQWRAAQRKRMRTINAAVRKMSSRKRATRKAGKLALQKYAQQIGDERLAAFAGEVATYYNAQWRAVKRRLQAQALTEVRATHSQLKRPIPTFQTSLGAGSTAVTIQLPELRGGVGRLSPRPCPGPCPFGPGPGP